MTFGPSLQHSRVLPCENPLYGEVAANYHRCCNRDPNENVYFKREVVNRIQAYDQEEVKAGEGRPGEYDARPERGRMCDPPLTQAAMKAPKQTTIMRTSGESIISNPWLKAISTSTNRAINVAAPSARWRIVIQRLDLGGSGDGRSPSTIGFRSIMAGGSVEER